MCSGRLSLHANSLFSRRVLLLAKRGKSQTANGKSDMAKKKAARKAKPAKKAVKKKVVKKRPVRKATAKKKVAKKVASKKPSKKKAARKATTKKAAQKKTAKAATKKSTTTKSRPMPLGRPKVTLDSKLEQLFLRDLEIREVCEFLGVTTLRDLEEYKADEIIEKLTAPVVNTVARMRKALAMTNRCLKGDQKFAKDFKKQVEAQMKKSRR